MIIMAFGAIWYLDPLGYQWPTPNLLGPNAATCLLFFLVVVRLFLGRGGGCKSFCQSSAPPLSGTGIFCWLQSAWIVIRATVNTMDRRDLLRADIGFYMGLHRGPF